jgi:hypothetical protein
MAIDVAFPGVIGARDIAMGSRLAIVVVESRCFSASRVVCAEDRRFGDSKSPLSRGPSDRLEDLPLAAEVV